MAPAENPESGETVTLLFVEVMGATTLWETYTDRFAEVRARCDVFARTRIAAHHGTLIKVANSGAVTFAAFPEAAEALACAGEILAGIAQDFWPAFLTAYGLRATLSTGVPVRSGNDYFGPVVIRGSRMLEIAGPWQILLNESTHRAVAQHPPPGWALRSLGSHRLRDLQESVALFDARHPGLPRPSRLDPASRALPVPMTTFIGREAECDRLAALLRNPESRLIVLHGMGGSGKTRLLIEALHTVESEFSDRLWYLSLSETPPKEIRRLLAQTLGGASDADIGDALRHALAGRRGLLALDSLEPWGERAIPLLERIQEVPGLTCVVASRCSLPFPKSLLFPVSPLSPAEAVALLVDRAQMVRPDFAVTPENRASLQEICALLDGLPLAIELAAPLLRGLSPAQLALRIQNQRLALAHAKRDVEPRHRTLHHCLAWSYDLLTPGEQTMFACLSVFAHSFTLPAAQTVGSAAGEIAEADVPALLERLQAHSLLLQDAATGETRYRLLALVHDFAMEKLGERPALLEEARRRHAASYAERVREARNHFTARGDSPYFEICARERDNILAGMTWAQNAGDHALFADYVRQLSVYFIEQGYWENFRQCVPLAMRYLEAQEDWKGYAALLSCCAHLAQRYGDYTTAIQELEHALSLGEKIGSPEYLCETVYNLGEMRRLMGDPAGAQARFEEAQRQAAALGYDLIADLVMGGRGELALARNDLETAERLLTTARARFLERDESVVVANLNIPLAWIAATRNDFAAAHGLLIASLDIRAGAGVRYATRHTLYHIARLFLQAAAFAPAQALFAFLIDDMTREEGVLRRDAQAGLNACQMVQLGEPGLEETLRIETLVEALALARNKEVLEWRK